MIITEYDLPRRTIEPHDVILDRDGNVWYSSFGEQAVGKMDPKTGKITEYSIPIQKPGWPTGELGLETDHDGNLWFGMTFQAAIAKFDRKTEKFQIFHTARRVQQGHDADQHGRSAEQPRGRQSSGRRTTASR